MTRIKPKQFAVIISVCIIILVIQSLGIFLNSAGPTIEEAYQSNLQNSTLTTGWYFTSKDDSSFLRSSRLLDKSFNLYPKPILTFKHIKHIKLSPIARSGYKKLELTMKFNDEGEKLWQESTSTPYVDLIYIQDDSIIHTLRALDTVHSGISFIQNNDFKRKDYRRLIKDIRNNKKEYSRKN